jgi:hypothetical protein
VVQQFLTALFADRGARGIPWASAQDPRSIREWIAQLAKLLAAMRSQPVREVESAWGTYEYTPPKPEQPRRAYAVLRNIARDHAIVHGRQQLSPEDLPLAARVTVSTMPSKCALVFPLVVEHKVVTVSQVQAALAVRHHATAQKVMEELGGRGVVEYIEGGPGKPTLFRFRAEWEWCTSPEFRAILLGWPVKNRGV